MEREKKKLGRDGVERNVKKTSIESDEEGKKTAVEIEGRRVC